jgi:hypothetical protein
MIASLPIGIIAFCIATVLGSFISLGISLFYTKKIFSISIIQMSKDFMPYFLLSIASCVPGFLLTFTTLPNIATLICGGLISTVLYFGYLFLRKDHTLADLISILPFKKSKLFSINK